MEEIKSKFNDEALIKLAQKIKPVIEDEDGQLQYVEPTDISSYSFIFAPLHKEKANGLEAINTIATKHECPLLFKPSVEEVLQQTPNNILNEKPVAFSVKFHSRDEGIIHNAETTFYKGTLPENVAKQQVVFKGKTIKSPTV